MAAAVTDLFTKVGNPGSATTLSAPGYTIGDVSITVGSTTNWPSSSETKVIFAIDRAEILNGVETRVAGTYNEFEGIVTGANTIASLTKMYGTAQNYAAGSLTRVYIPVASTRENEMVDGLNQDHNAKGNHKNLTDDNGNEFLERGQTASAVNHLKATNSITGAPPVLSAAGDDANVNAFMRGKGTGVAHAENPEILFDHVASGGVWTGDSYGVNRNASMTAIVVYINGQRGAIAAVTARTFSASLDTYIDVLNTAGVFTLVYTTAANNAASPALAANSIRIGIIVAAAGSIVNVGSVNQGEEGKILPIASSIPYAVTDSLGNLICSRNSIRKLLGQRQIVADFTSTATPALTDVTGLNVPVIVPAGGRKVKISYHPRHQTISSAAGNGYDMAILEDGVVVMQASQTSGGANWANPVCMERVYTPAAGSHTYKLQFSQGAAGTFTIAAGATYPATLKIELE